MIRKVEITNYKSVPSLTLQLGRVNVLIGANGSGKSNILEAIALAAAAAQDKLDNEFLVSRGLRVTETRFMCAAFEKPRLSNPKNDPGNRNSIEVEVEEESKDPFKCKLFPDESASYPRWRHSMEINLAEMIAAIQKVTGNANPEFEPKKKITPETFKSVLDQLWSTRAKSAGKLREFLIYAPENSVLRTFQSEGQVLPLGIRGEGLFAHLKGLGTEPHKERLKSIKERLTLLEWFETFDIPDDLGTGERSIRIRDRHILKNEMFDQRSANEGFLYLLFYITLLISPDTPSFFAIDNVDSSLNPKLCVALLQEIILLANKYDKQLILTTHSPAILDGLNLAADEQRLFVIDRNKDGFTRARRIEAPKAMEGQPLVRLSEAFMRGYIGGLPKNF